MAPAESHPWPASAAVDAAPARTPALPEPTPEGSSGRFPDVLPTRAGGTPAQQIYTNTTKCHGITGHQTCVHTGMAAQVYKHGGHDGTLTVSADPTELMQPSTRLCAALRCPSQRRHTITRVVLQPPSAQAAFVQMSHKSSCVPKIAFTPAHTRLQTPPTSRRLPVAATPAGSPPAASHAPLQ